jgi:SAM-dependent methyltransferase
MRSSFRPGFLFPEFANISQERLRRIRFQKHDAHRSQRKELKYDGSGEAPWVQWDTKLKNYTVHGSVSDDTRNFEMTSYLEDKADQASVNGQTLQVLDIGIGSGNQWIDFLQKHPIDLHGTALSLRHVNPLLSGKVKRSLVINLHSHFKPGSFDVIVSHFGMHQQEKEALEQIIHLLKPGGEAIVQGELGDNPVSDSHSAYYKILYAKQSTITGAWRYHIIKKS